MFIYKLLVLLHFPSRLYEVHAFANVIGYLLFIRTFNIIISMQIYRIAKKRPKLGVALSVLFFLLHVLIHRCPFFRCYLNVYFLMGCIPQADLELIFAHWKKIQHIPFESNHKIEQSNIKTFYYLSIWNKCAQNKSNGYLSSNG